MNDTDVLSAVKESIADVHLDRPLETIIAAGRDRRRTRAARAVVATVAVAALGVSVLSLNSIATPTGQKAAPGTGAQAPPNAQPVGFTLVRNADGSVTFTVTDVLDPAAATQALNDAGITGRVIRMGANPACTQTTINPTDMYPDDSNGRPFRGGASTATFSSSDYPAGGGLLLLVLVFEDLPHRLRTPLPPAVLSVAFDDAAKIPTCMNPDIEPGTGP